MKRSPRRGRCFFFQAEDGIRDYKVTGVQTCALPISLQMGCWTPLEGFAREPRTDALWSARAVHGVQDFSRFEILEGGQPRGTVQWSQIGRASCRERV